MSPPCLALLLAALLLIVPLPNPTLAAYSQGSQVRLRISQEEKLNRRRLFEQYLRVKASRIPAAFYEQLQEGRVLHRSSLKTKTPNGERCDLNGTISYSLNRLESNNGTVAVMAQGQQQHQSLQEERHQWTLTFSLPSFNADMTAQLMAVLSCDQQTSITDFTSYGHVSIENAVIKATVQLEGPNHEPHVIDVVEHMRDQHQIVIEKSNPTFQTLLTKVPEGVIEDSVHEFLHNLFTEHLQRVMETQLLVTASRAELLEL